MKKNLFIHLAQKKQIFEIGNRKLDDLIRNSKISSEMTEKIQFFEGIKDVKAGCKVGNISHKIQAYLEKNGYGVVRELVGHGIGREMHEDPMIPNYGPFNSGIVLEAGMTLAIEPMSTLGRRNVVLASNGWTVVTEDGLPSAHYENTVIITNEGVEILTL